MSMNVNNNSGFDVSENAENNRMFDNANNDDFFDIFDNPKKTDISKSPISKTSRVSGEILNDTNNYFTELTQIPQWNTHWKDNLSDK